MGFNLDVSVPVLTVFAQGLLSFFSACVLPLLPLYIGYLSGGTGVMGEDGRIYYKRSRVLLNTCFFVVGVSFAFFLLGAGVSALGTFFRGNQTLFVRLGAIFIILFGLYQLGVFGSSEVLGQEKRLHLNLEKFGMSPITALLLGFTFSFAWTPCVGPALASVLLMAASAESKAAGFLLIGVYTLGFVLPFLAVGMFTTSLLEFFKKHRSVVKYTVKIGAVLMILMGVLMFTGKMNAITGYLSKFPSVGNEQNAGTEQEDTADAAGEKETTGTDVEGEAAGSDAGPDVEEETAGNAAGEAAGQENAGEGTVGNSQNAETDAGNTADSEQEELPTVPAIDFTLTDQYGNEHTLSDYKGKTVFLNFWATWCSPCRREMPDIQKLYEEYQAEEDADVVILGVAAPNYGQEVSEDEIKKFLEKNGYTYPVVMDTDAEMFQAYMVYSFPTTFMIDKDGNIFGYVTGQINEDIMRDIIRQTVEGVRR